MTVGKHIEVLHDTTFGPFVVCRSTDLADEFDDFLTEETDYTYSIKFNLDGSSFYFSPRRSTVELDAIISSFGSSII